MNTNQPEQPAVQPTEPTQPVVEPTVQPAEEPILGTDVVAPMPAEEEKPKPEEEKPKPKPILIDENFKPEYNTWKRAHGREGMGLRAIETLREPPHNWEYDPDQDKKPRKKPTSAPVEALVVHTEPKQPQKPRFSDPRPILWNAYKDYANKPTLAAELPNPDKIKTYQRMILGKTIKRNRLELQCFRMTRSIDEMDFSKCRSWKEVKELKAKKALYEKKIPELGKKIQDLDNEIIILSSNLSTLKTDGYKLN